jgi:DDE superfamily endonuclease
MGRNELLLMDGYGSHNTFECVIYAKSHGIHLYYLPPHTTHFLQPLDVGCFQPLKHHHGRALNLTARYLEKEFIRTEFLVALA